MTTEELIEEAKSRYPAGTKFSNTNIFRGIKGVKTVKDGWEVYSSTEQNRIVCNTSPTGRYTIYREGNWAEIVEIAENQPFVDAQSFIFKI